MNLGQIVLYSDHQYELSRYISSLFDLEVEPDEFGIKIKQGDMVFCICSKDESIGPSGNSTILDFHLDSMNELCDLLRKIQFYYYRIETDSSGKKKDVDIDVPKIEQKGNCYFFCSKDPDGRIWRFSYVDLL